MGPAMHKVEGGFQGHILVLSLEAAEADLPSTELYHAMKAYEERSRWFH